MLPEHLGRSGIQRRLQGARVWLIRRRMDLLAHRATAAGVIARAPGSEELVVSLTTIPHRVPTLHRVIESIFQQRVKPHRVLLWIGREYFPDDSWLTPALRRQLRRGLTIMYDEREWPHKKLIPSLRAFPTAHIVTIDDDVIYNRDLLGTLAAANSRSDGRQVVASLTRRIAVEGPGTFAEYARWEQNSPSLQSRGEDLLPLGVGGVLYPPGVLHRDVLNEETALELAPRQDDLWFKIMGLRQGAGVALAPVAGGHGHNVSESAQDVSLWEHNANGANDIAWASLCEAFGVSPSDAHFSGYR